MKNPMHFFGMVGILLGLAGACVLTYFGIEWLITGSMHLRPLVLLSIGSVIMGIQFISIGLIGELITHVTQHNVYSIRESLGQP